MSVVEQQLPRVEFTSEPAPAPLPQAAPAEQRVSLSHMETALASLAAKTRWGVVNLTYRRGIMSPQLLRDMRGASDDADEIAIIQHIKKIVAEWDIIDDPHANPPTVITPSDPRVARFDTYLLADILQAITADISPGEASANGSSMS